MNTHHWLLILLALYLTASSVGLNGFEFFWDETQNTAPSIFLYDFLHQPLGEMSFQDMKDYALDYHAHYQFALNFLLHPPFHRAIITVSYIFMGISEFSSRFPTVLFGVLGILATYLLAKDITGDKKIALISATTLAISAYYFIYTRMAMMEVIITTFVTLSIYSFSRYCKENTYRNAIIFGILTGFAMLTKIYGFLIIPILVMYVFLTRKHRLLLDKKLWLSMTIALSLSAPWYIFSFFVAPTMLEIPPIIFSLYTSLIKVGGFDLLNALIFFFKQFLFRDTGGEGPKYLAFVLDIHLLCVLHDPRSAFFVTSQQVRHACHAGIRHTHGNFP